MGRAPRTVTRYRGVDQSGRSPALGASLAQRCAPGLAKQQSSERKPPSYALSIPSAGPRSWASDISERGVSRSTGQRGSARRARRVRCSTEGRWASLQRRLSALRWREPPRPSPPADSNRGASEVIEAPMAHHRDSPLLVTPARQRLSAPPAQPPRRALLGFRRRAARAF